VLPVSLEGFSFLLLLSLGLPWLFGLPPIVNAAYVPAITTIKAIPNEITTAFFITPPLQSVPLFGNNSYKSPARLVTSTKLQFSSTSWLEFIGSSFYLIQYIL
jgi:hypothetical protein